MFKRPLKNSWNEINARAFNRENTVHVGHYCRNLSWSLDECVIMYHSECLMGFVLTYTHFHRTHKLYAQTTEKPQKYRQCHQTIPITKLVIKLQSVLYIATHLTVVTASSEAPRAVSSLTMGTMAAT